MEKQIEQIRDDTSNSTAKEALKNLKKDNPGLWKEKVRSNRLLSPGRKKELYPR